MDSNTCKLLIGYGESKSAVGGDQLLRIAGEWFEQNKLTINHLTARDYLNKVRDFIWLFGINRPKDLSSKHVCEHITKLVREKNLSPSTIKGYVNAISSFCKYLIMQGLMTENPCQKIKRPKIEKSMPRYLNDEEYCLTLKMARICGIYREVLMGLKTGMRVSEMAKLEWSDIIFDSNVIIVRGKGNKIRSIPLHSELKTELLKTPLEKRKGHVFAQCCIRMWHYRFEPIRNAIPAYTECWDGRRVGRAYHLLRHTFATRLVMQGVSIFKVSKYLGHSSVAMTERYAHYIPRYDSDIEKA